MTQFDLWATFSSLPHVYSTPVFHFILYVSACWAGNTEFKGTHQVLVLFSLITDFWKYISKFPGNDPVSLIQHGNKNLLDNLTISADFIMTVSLQYFMSLLLRNQIRAALNSKSYIVARLRQTVSEFIPN